MVPRRRRGGERNRRRGADPTRRVRRNGTAPVAIIRGGARGSVRGGGARPFESARDFSFGRSRHSCARFLRRGWRRLGGRAFVFRFDLGDARWFFGAPRGDGHHSADGEPRALERDNVGERARLEGHGVRARDAVPRLHEAFAEVAQAPVAQGVAEVRIAARPEARVEAHGVDVHGALQGYPGRAHLRARGGGAVQEEEHQRGAETFPEARETRGAGRVANEPATRLRARRARGRSPSEGGHGARARRRARGRGSEACARARGSAETRASVGPSQPLARPSSGTPDSSGLPKRTL
jgi:hypothetical protein